MAYRQDGRDHMRREYNGILLDKASGSNNLVQEKYITVSVGQAQHRGGPHLLRPRGN